MVSIAGLTAVKTATSVLQTFASLKPMNKSIVVSATMPKQKTIDHPKITKPKVSQARAFTQKVIPGKVQLPLLKLLSLQLKFTVMVAQLKTPEFSSPWRLR